MRSRMAGGPLRLVTPAARPGSVQDQVADRLNKPRLLRGECPKCDLHFNAPEQYGISICDCGWFLKLEPIRAGRVGGHYEEVLSVDAVMEVVPPGHKVEDQLCQDRARVALQRVIENWRQRGLAKLEIDAASGRFGLRMPTHEVEYDERAERKYREEQGN